MTAHGSLKVSQRVTNMRALKIAKPYIWCSFPLSTPYNVVMPATGMNFASNSMHAEPIDGADDCGWIYGLLIGTRPMATTYKPGETAPRSGQYQIVGTTVERTVTRGEPLPPTPRKGQEYRLVDPTKHKSTK